MSPSGLLVTVMFAIVGLVGLAKVAMIGATAVNSIGPPPAAVQGADATAGDKVVSYFEQNPRACPSISVSPDLAEKFPDLPAVLAVLKFTLSQQQWLPEPAIAGTTNIRLPAPQFADRVQLVGLLNDRSLQLDYVPLEDKRVAGFADGADRIVLTHLGANDSSLKKGRNTAFGLGFNILHELVHVQQVRNGQATGGIDIHSDPAKEAEANSYALRMPRSLFAGPAWERVRAANICSSSEDVDDPDPVEPGGKVTGSLILVFDASGSMGEEVSPGVRRMDVAKQSVRELLTGNALPPGVEVGLLIYYDCDRIEWEPFTHDYSELLYWVEAAEPSGSTPLAAAIDEAAGRMRDEAARNGQPGDIIVVSDGRETCGGDPYGAAARARQQPMPADTQNRIPAPAPRAVTASLAQEGGEVRVSTIGLAVSEDVDRELAGIAQEGGGIYLPAGDVDALTDALGEAISVGQPFEDPPVPAVIAPSDLRESSPSPWPWFAAAAVAAAVSLGAGAIAVRQLQRVPAAELELPCEACGASNTGDLAFCVRCGQPLPWACPACGTVSRSGAQFCRGCGRAR